MSRRRRLDPLLEAMRTTPDWRVEVVCACTGRRRRIGVVTSRNGNPPMFDGFDGAVVLDGDQDHTNVVARCHACGTNVPLHLDRARAVLADIAVPGSGVSVELARLAASMEGNSEVDPD